MRLLLVGFNSFFTGLGVWFYCFDVDLPTKRYCLEHPQFYWSGAIKHPLLEFSDSTLNEGRVDTGQQYQKANFAVAGGFLARGVYQAVVCAFGAIFLLYTAADDEGNPITRQTLGYTVFTAMLFGMTVQLALHSNTIRRINWTIGLVGTWTNAAFPRCFSRARLTDLGCLWQAPSSSTLAASAPTT